MAKSNNDNLLNSMLYESDAAYIGSKSKNQVVMLWISTATFFIYAFYKN